MQRKSEEGMRKYIGDNLDRGHSLDDIRATLIRHDYSENMADAMIVDYKVYLEGKDKLVSNNLLAVILVTFMLLSVVSNFYILSNIPQVTGMATGDMNATGVVSMCVNSQPVLNITDCLTEINVTDVYYCNVNASDADWNYTEMYFLFYDNATLFNVTNITNTSAEINFTSIYPDHLGGAHNTIMNYTIELWVCDGSTCSNENTTEILNLIIMKGCSVKIPPEFNNFSDNYTTIRNNQWSLEINATDVDFEDGISYTIDRIDYDAYTDFSTGNYLSIGSNTGIWNISPYIIHVGWHLLNVSIKDNSSCTNDTTWKLVNITVEANNTPPRFNGSLSELGQEWEEDKNRRDYIELNTVFEDNDGDCLKFELSREVADDNETWPINITITNNDDPREYFAPGVKCLSHYVTLTPRANWWGVEYICFTANDTIDTTTVCVNYTVTDRAEPRDPVPGASDVVPSGGGGGAPSPARCEERWYCGSWNPCISGFMIRNCTDMNECLTSKFKPNETESCISIAHCYDKTQNYGETGIDCGGECPTSCSTCYDATMNCHNLLNGSVSCEDGVDCGGPCRPCLEDERVRLDIGEGELPSPEEMISLGRYYLVMPLLILLLIIIWVIKKIIASRKKEKQKEKKKKKKEKERVWHRISMSWKEAKEKMKEAMAKKEIVNKEHIWHITMSGKKSKRIEKTRIWKNKLDAIIGSVGVFFAGLNKTRRKEKEMIEVPLKIISELKKLSGLIGKESNDHIIKELGTKMKAWLKKRFDIEYEVTYEELGSMLKERKKDAVIWKSIKPFFDKFVHIQYAGEEMTVGFVHSLINEAMKIVLKYGAGINADIKEGEGIVKSVKPKNKGKKVTMAIILLMVFLGSMLFVFNPEITGRFIADVGENTVFINDTFIGDSFVNLDIRGDLDLINSIMLNGAINEDTIAKVYVGSVSNNHLVFDSQVLLAERNSARKSVKTDQIQEFNDGEKGIDLKIDYNPDTPWDDNNDGIALRNGAVDITIGDTIFNWMVDEDKLCTLWKIGNKYSSDYSCYGSADCCLLLEMAPERDRWDDTLYINYGKDGAVDENIVSARVIYADYSIEAGDAYSEIIESETENISVIFNSDTIEFKDICLESCIIDGLSSNKLILEISKGELYLDNVDYILGDDTSLLNSAPEFSIVPNISLEKNKEYVIDLNDYVSDVDGDDLFFGYYRLDDVDIVIEDGIVVINSKEDFEGKAYTFFTVNDSKTTAVSNIVEIIVGEKSEGDIEEIIDGISEELDSISEGTLQGKATIGQPVRWIKRTTLNDSKIRLDYVPINMTVKKIVGVEKIKIDDSKIKLELVSKLNSLQIGAVSDIALQSEEMMSEAVVTVQEEVNEVEVEYYTEAPLAIEENISEFKKRVTISSDVHYNNIKSFVEIADKPLDSIKLYHVIEGTREEVKFKAVDRDGNGLIDYIEWNVPHLSEQIYEIEINILNVQSYPIVGGEWEVRFTTVGKANLSISAINDTSYGATLPDDLIPYELRCGETVLNYTWAGENSVEYNDYECNETGYWIVTVLTEGIHNQKFIFGGAEAYANNLASVQQGDSNLTIWDSQDIDGANKYSSSQITFYANYTNGTETANGTCTIKFNFSGESGWRNESNMTYSSPAVPWAYTRNVSYKGTNYYNILCQNESMITLNATDLLAINNTAPTLNITPEGYLPSMYCTEDLLCSYEVSQQANDIDNNDALRYTYDPDTVDNLTAPLCTGCFSLDSSNGSIIIDITSSDESDRQPFHVGLFARDDDDVYSQGGILTIYVTEVNDPPQITTLVDGDSLPDATTDVAYTYTVTATDEEDGTPPLFNFTLLSCQRQYPPPGAPCSESRISMEKTGPDKGKISFTPENADAGNYTLLISVNDSGDLMDTVTVNFSIRDTNDRPQFDYVCGNYTQTAVEDIKFNCTINATDPDNDLLVFHANVSWFDSNIFTVDDNEVVFNFTPSNSMVGDYTITLNVSDGLLSETIAINFTINNTNDEPWLYNVSQQLAIADLIYNYYLVGYDDDLWQPYNTFYPENDNLTFDVNFTDFSISKYNDTAALISFTPTIGQQGNYTIMANVTDLSNTTFNLTFNLTIRNNTAPEFVWICNNSRIIQEEVLHQCDINATDLEGDNFTFSVNASWFSIDSQTGDVSFMTNDSEVGNHTINFTVIDSWGWSNSRNEIFEVNNTPEAPEIVLSNLTFMEGERKEVDISANVTDQDMNTSMGDVLRYYSNASFTGSFEFKEFVGIINFTPDNDDVGIHHVRFTINDSYDLSTEIVVNLTVDNVNNPPILNEYCRGNNSAMEDLEYNCQVGATDSDVSDTLIYIANVVGGNGWFTINSSTGFVNFTPLNEQVGQHQINISVSDGSIIESKIINFSVNNTNDVPALSAIPSLNATEDHVFEYTVTATDDDFYQPDDSYHAESEDLNFTTNSSLFNISKLSETQALINFTPLVNQVGNHTIIINVTDQNGSVDTLAFNLTIYAYNDPPVLGTIPNLVIDEAVYFYYDVNATDEEDNESDLRFWSNASAEIFIMNYTSGEINFTPNSTFVGNHTINVSVNDTAGNIDSQLFNLTIRPLNFKPNITEIRPYGHPISNETIFSFANSNLFPNNLTSIVLSENTTILFNHTSTDANYDTLRSKWYKDGLLLSTSSNDSSYYYEPGFYEAGQHNLTVIVDDMRWLNATFIWNVTVNNTNRKPMFGIRGNDIYSDYKDGNFSTGSSNNNNTNTTSGGIILAVNASGDYQLYGEYISEVIDTGFSPSSFYNPIEYTNISWGTYTPSGTNVTLQTRSSYNSVTWSNWSIMQLNESYINYLGEEIVSADQAYIQYKVILQTNDSSITPNVTSVKINHIIPDITMNQGDMAPNWIDLDDYFYDLDSDDNLIFTFSDLQNVNITLDDITHIVSIEASEDWYGTEPNPLYFVANDSYGLTYSNNITIIVEAIESQSSLEYLYITNTKIVMRTKTRTITEPRYLELLAPKHLTTFDDTTVVAPLVLMNNADAILNGIKLTAEVNSENVEFWFEEDNFEGIAPGESLETNLFIKWDGIIDEFDVIVNATSTDPAYTDSALISVTGMSRVVSNKSIEESHIEFVRDLLNNNPECLELTELLLQAKKHFEEGKYIETKNTLNFIIEGCKYLITENKEGERPTPIKQRDGDLFKLIAGILLLLLLIAMIIIIALTSRERNMS